MFLVDLLEHLEFATYDDGPGQMMLRETEFFDAMKGRHCASSTPIAIKIDRLFELLKDGNRRLIENRKRTMADFEKLIAVYKAQKIHVIDQAGLGFVNEPNKD